MNICILYLDGGDASHPSGTAGGAGGGVNREINGAEPCREMMF